MTVTSPDDIGTSRGSIVEAMKIVAQNETKKLHIAELAVVTAVYPHGNSSDNNNYECDIELKEKNVELKKVAVATQHIGLANIPHNGDLVLVTFVNGDINSPIIIGRLYNDSDRPPISNEEELVYEPPYTKNEDLRRIQITLPNKIVDLRFNDNSVRLEAGKSFMTANSEGEIVIKSRKNNQETEGAKLAVTTDNIGIEVIGAGGLCKITMDAGGIHLESTANLIIEAAGTVTIKGAMVKIN